MRQVDEQLRLVTFMHDGLGYCDDETYGSSRSTTLLLAAILCQYPVFGNRRT